MTRRESDLVCLYLKDNRIAPDTVHAMGLHMGAGDPSSLSRDRSTSEVGAGQRYN